MQFKHSFLKQKKLSYEQNRPNHLTQISDQNRLFPKIYFFLFYFKRSTLIGIFLLLFIYVFTFVIDVLASISYCVHKSEQTNIPHSNQYMLINCLDFKI